MECRDVRKHLAAFQNRPGEGLTLGVEAHVRHCAACRAELAGYREMAAALAVLRDRPVEPPAWLLPTLLEAVGRRAHRIEVLRSGVRQVSDPRVAAAGGALLLAGAAALLIRGRRRRSPRRRVRHALVPA